MSNAAEDEKKADRIAGIAIVDIKNAVAALEALEAIDPTRARALKLEWRAVLTESLGGLGLLDALLGVPGARR